MVVCALFLSLGMAVAQNVDVTGTVTDSNGEPVAGAYVVIKGTQTGVVTDAEGNYKIGAPSDGTIAFSCIGYKKAEVAVNGRTRINISLKEDAELLQDAVVVGFGTQKKINLTGSVSSVDVNKAFNSKPITDIGKGLQGVVPGLTVTYTTNDQGSGASIKIRGMGSINGSNKPLILLDGVEIDDLSFVNPTNVANISVLKDAASASIYGSRAAYGVLLITTKDGSNLKDKVSITYSNNFSWNQPINLPKYCTGYNVIDMLNEGILAQKNTDGTDIEAFGMYYKDLVDPIKNWLDNYYGQDLGNVMVYGRDYTYNGSGTAQFYRVWNPNKELLKNASFQQKHDIAITGNSGKTNYNVTAGYSYQDGLLKAAKSQFIDRYNINMSQNTQLFKWLNFGTKVMYTEKHQEYPYGYGSSDSTGGLYYYSMRFPTFFPYGISDGAYDSSTDSYLNDKTKSGEGLYFRHGNGFVAYAPTCTSDDEFLRISANMKISFSKNFSFYADYTRGKHNYINKTISQPQYVANWWSSYSPKIAYTSNDYLANTWVKKTSNTFNSYFDYVLDIRKEHHFAFKLGMNSEDLTYNSNYLKSLGVQNINLPTMNLTDGKASATVDESLADRATAGFFARVNYNYKEKYIFELNGRYDGSSQFKEGQKWAFFPSASVGWRVSEEEFMKSIDEISNLKIRASYGTIGNQDIDSKSLAWYPYIGTISDSNSDWVNQSGIYAASTTMPSIVGQYMTWEKINTLDFGVDLGLLNGDLNATFDWYERRNIGMLVPRNEVAAVGGFPNLPKENSGDLKTNGWELEIDYNHIFNRNFSVYATGTISDSKSVITKWNVSTGALTGNYEGKILGEIWGFKTSDGSGYFTADEVTNGVQTAAGIKSIADYQGNLAKGAFTYGEGDIKYQDLNGDGVVDTGKGTIDDHGDLVRIGNNLPRYEYSLRVGAQVYGFDAEILLQGIGKRDVWTTTSLLLPHVAGAQMNIFSDQLDYYTSENTNAKFPRPYIGQTGSTVNGFSTYTGNNNFYPQTKYLANFAYLRLKNLTVGYTLPHSLVSKALIEKARVYASVENLLTFDHLNHDIDPELTGGWSTVSSIDVKYAGRATPFCRMWSFGVQITF
jgi:TonB-linked SusC/RagA family outer membrane protein